MSAETARGRLLRLLDEDPDSGFAESDARLRGWAQGVTAPVTAEDILRTLVRVALRNAGLSQAEAARRLGVSTKHLCQMLTGRAALTLPWAEAILRLCGQRLTLDTAPIHRPEEAP